MKDYTIKAGQHYSRFFPQPWIKLPNCSVKGKFTESCIHNLNSADQWDWSKLYGLTYGFDVHYNSARWAWRYNPDTGLFELAPYYYIRGARYMNEPLMSVKADEEFSLDITTQDDYWIFWYGKDGFGADRQTDNIRHGKLACFGIKNYPFFGGNSTLHKDIHILLGW